MPPSPEKVAISEVAGGSDVGHPSSGAAQLPFEQL